MLDIIFIAYDEPNADVNFRALKSRFPHAKRIQGIKGIAAAHITAAKKANTTFFYVVDADTEIFDSFRFDYKPTEHEANYVHIWHAYNPATGLDYGYGGIKLFSKKFFKDVKSQLDFSTTLTKDIKIMEEIVCTTRFNSDPFRAFRGAFRECIKLYTTSHNKTLQLNIQEDARERLACWMTPLRSCEFRNYVIAGANAGIAEAKHREKDQDSLLYINDPDLLLNIFAKSYPEIDLNVDAQPKENHPMRPEFFFTTRIASALYDQYVTDHLPVTELRDAISDGQMGSKLWLIDELRKLKIAMMAKPRVAILGGWIGTLSLLMNCYELELKITSIDLDERANRIAEKLNYDYDFSTKTMDMYSVDYDEYDIIINTSSEHIPDIAKWRLQIPAGKIIIIQNTDFEEGDGHVSTVRDVAELRKILNLTEVFYEGSRKFPQYSRFMIIGRT